MFIGALLMLVGIVMLLDQTGILPGRAWDYVVPLAIIALGISIISGYRKGKKKGCDQNSSNKF